jgi:IS30 family transposase
MMVRELEVVDAGCTPVVAEREEIALGIASGRSLTGIARGVGHPVATVAREVARNGGRGRCRAVVAERATRLRACRPKPRRLATDRALGREVERRLQLRHSPERPANRLRLEHPESALVGVP